MSKPEYEATASFLASARRRKGMTKADLSRASGVSEATLSRVEQAKRGLGKEAAAKLAPVLGVPVLSLIYPPKKRQRRAA